MTSAQALALLFFVMGALFVALGIAPLWFFDRMEFWQHQAEWFRANKIGSMVGRVVWGGFGLFLWAMAVVAIRR